MQIDSAPSDGSVPVKQEDVSHSGWQNFPNGLRVLVVDDDPLCLKVIEQMLRRCNYEVHTCTNGAAALEQLRDKSHGFDLVLSDVYMPDMDGFKLLEAIGLELDLPVIMMSSNGEHSTVLRGVTHGAVDFLIKPVRIEELRNIWQHVLRRTSRHAASSQMQSSGDMDQDDLPGEAETCRKRKDAGRESASEREEEGSSSKKPRVVWSAEMHLQFVHAVNQLGIDKAVPKKILEIMKVDGLTRENVASHLQKYRLYLKRVQGVSSAGGHQHGGKGGEGKPGPGLGSSPPLQQQQQHHHNGVQLADMGLAPAPGMVPVQLPGPTPFAAAAVTAVPLPAAGPVPPAAPPQVVPPVMLQQQGSSVLPPAAGVPPAASQAPTAAAAAAMPAGLPPPMAGLMPPGMMPGVMAGMQPGMAAMQMNALMGMGMAGLGLPGLGMPPPGAGPMLGNLGAMGLPAMGMGGLPGMPGMQPPNLPGMGMGMPGVPGMGLGPGMMNPADPNALMMAFQAMLQANGRPPAAVPAGSSLGSGSTGTAPAMAAVGLPAASTMPSMGHMPGAAVPMMGGAAGDAGGVLPPLVASAALPAAGGSLEGGVAAMEGLGSPLGADKLLPDVMDFSTMFEDNFQVPGAPGSAALGGGDIGGGGVDEFLDMLLQG